MNVVLTAASHGSSGFNVVLIGLYVLFFIALFIVVHIIVKKKQNAKITRVCPNCGQYNYGQVNFCKFCGAELPNESKKVTGKKICPNCGFITESNTAFCPKCGKNI